MKLRVNNPAGTEATGRLLVKKIKNLRELCGLTQAQFAKKLKAYRPQVYKWEKGTERPSARKLIELGNLADRAIHQWEGAVVPEGKVDALENAAEYPDSFWFWEGAGVDLSLIREAERRKIKEQPDQEVLDKKVRLPLLDSAALLRFVRGDLKDLGTGFATSVPFASLFVREPSLTICVQATDRLGRSDFFAGDLVLIQCARRKGDGEKAQPAPHAELLPLLGARVALFFESLPVSRELSPEAWRRRPPARLFTDQDRLVNEANSPQDPAERAEEERKREELGQKYLSEASAPGAVFGRLRLQSDESWDGDLDKLRDGRPWRAILDCGGTLNGLTDWTTDPLAFSGASVPRANPGIHLLGAIVGWLVSPVEQRLEPPASSPRTQVEKAIRPPDCECGRRCACKCHQSGYRHSGFCCGPGSKAHEALCGPAKRRRVASGRKS
ncbi:MAG: helix-turn-helix transcriptional regulator [Terracidiphilus sp.]